MMLVEVVFTNDDARFFGTCESCFSCSDIQVLACCFFLLVIWIFQSTITKQVSCFGTQSVRVDNHKTNISPQCCHVLRMIFFQPTSDDSAQGKAGSLGSSVLGSRAPCYRSPRQQLAKCDSARCISVPPCPQMQVWDPYTQ